MAERGGVGTRLYVVGGGEVRREFNAAGDAGKRMFAEIANGQKAANPALVAFSRTVGEVRGGVEGLADSTGGASRILGAFGAAGIGVAAGLGAVGVAVNQARTAIAFADEIADSAQRINVSTDALQEYRYALLQTGGEATDADAALQAFTATLGAAESGLSPKAMKAFSALGFTEAQLKSFGSMEEALNEVTRRIAGLSKESERAAIAEKLGLSSLLPLLRQGADGVAELRQEAHDLGYVLDADVAQKGSDAADKLEALGQTIKVQLSAAFIDLAPAILQATEAFAGFMRTVADFANNPDTQRAVGYVGQIFGGFAKGGFIGGGKALYGVMSDNNKWAKYRREFSPLAKDYGMDQDDPDFIRRGIIQDPKDYGARGSLGGGGKGGSKKAKAPKYGTVPEYTANMGQAVDLTDYVYTAKKVDLSVQLQPNLNEQLQPQLDQMREGVHDAWSDGIYAALNGNLWDFIKSRLMEAAVDGLATSLAGMFAKGLGGSGGLLGGIGSVLSSIFVRHAAGGPAIAGQGYSAAEFGPEIGIFGRPGQIFDAGTTQRIIAGALGGGGAGAGGASGVQVNATYAPNITVAGSGPEIDALRRQLAQDRMTFEARVEAAVNAGLIEGRVRAGV